MSSPGNETDRIDKCNRPRPGGELETEIDTQPSASIAYTKRRVMEHSSSLLASMLRSRAHELCLMNVVASLTANSMDYYLTQTQSYPSSSVSIVEAATLNSSNNSQNRHSGRYPMSVSSANSVVSSKSFAGYNSLGGRQQFNFQSPNNNHYYSESNQGLHTIQGLRLAGALSVRNSIYRTELNRMRGQGQSQGHSGPNNFISHGDFSNISWNGSVNNNRQPSINSSIYSMSEFDKLMSLDS